MSNPKSYLSNHYKQKWVTVRPFTGLIMEQKETQIKIKKQNLKRYKDYSKSYYKKYVEKGYIRLC